jgi:enoyl-CoA hydratase/carnithine racemase
MGYAGPDAWKHVAVSRHDRITQLTFHTDGAPMVWNGRAHQETAEALAWLRSDSDTHVVILTGAGDAFCEKFTSPSTEKEWYEIWSEGRRFISDLVELDVPIISVVNGPATVHAELLVLADIVLAVPEATFADRAHMVRGVVPGDGAQVVWRNLLGASRSNYFLLTGETINSEDALSLGFVHEIHERDQIFERALQLAAPLSRLSRATLAYTRASLRHADRLLYSEAVGYGLALAGLSIATNKG